MMLSQKRVKYLSIEVVKSINATQLSQMTGDAEINLSKGSLSFVTKTISFIHQDIYMLLVCNLS